MPFSWVKAMTATSERIRACQGDDRSKRRFEQCVREIVASDGGSVESVWFELNAKFAHIHLWWETLEQKAAILYDLEAEEVVDLVSADEADELIAKRRAAAG